VQHPGGVFDISQRAIEAPERRLFAD
jgi:hypothetical protein